MLDLQSLVKNLATEELSLIEKKSQELCREGNRLFKEQLDQSKLDNYQRIIQLYEEAFKVDRRNPNAYVGLALLYVNFDRAEKAMELLNLAISVEPMNEKLRNLFREVNKIIQENHLKIMASTDNRVEQTKKVYEKEQKVEDVIKVKTIKLEEETETVVETKAQEKVEEEITLEPHTPNIEDKGLFVRKKINHYDSTI